jgi:hypothetical protein
MTHYPVFQWRIGHIFYLFFLIALYFLIFYQQSQSEIKMDYTSYYYSTLHLNKHENPYQVFKINNEYFNNKEIVPNINPPFMLFLTHSISYLPFFKGLFVWDTINICLFIGNALLIAYLLRRWYPDIFLWQPFLLTYFGLFCNTSNIIIGQVGFLITFFVLMGYLCLMRGYTRLAGIWWGVIASLKLFPLFLVVYLFSLKAYRAIVYMILIFMMTNVFAGWYYGVAIFSAFHSLISKVLWYGDNWNLSLFGYIFRVFIDVYHPWKALQWLQFSYFMLIGLLALCYLRYMSTLSSDKKWIDGFLMSLFLMLFLSPFGWFYYGNLLVLPLYVVFLRIQYTVMPFFTRILGYVGLFLLLVPVIYFSAANIHFFYEKISIYSYLFYGLIMVMLVNYQLSYEPNAELTSKNTLADLTIVLNYLMIFQMGLPLVYLVALKTS